jgi:hypothetical protein
MIKHTFRGLHHQAMPQLRHIIFLTNSTMSHWEIQVILNFQVPGSKSSSNVQHGQTINIVSLFLSFYSFPCLIKIYSLWIAICIFPTVFLLAMIFTFVLFPQNLYFLFMSLSICKALTYSIHDPAAKGTVYADKGLRQVPCQVLDRCCWSEESKGHQERHQQLNKQHQGDCEVQEFTQHSFVVGIVADVLSAMRPIQQFDQEWRGGGVRRKRRRRRRRRRRPPI